MPSQRELIQSALEKLGPERVVRGLAAFDDPHAGGSFSRCFLGRTYGEPLKLVLAVEGGRGGYLSLLGLEAEEMWAVIHAFDDTPHGLCEKMTRQELRDMIVEYARSHMAPPVPEDEPEDELEAVCA